MAKKAARRKTATHKKVSAKKFSFDQLLTKEHRPLHFAGLGTIMLFLQGLVAVIGVLLIVGAAITYAMRAMKSSR